MPAFLDPTQPIATCARESCEGCPAAQLVHCHFRAPELAHFFLNAMPAFVVGGAGIVRWRWWALLPWAAMALGYFGLLEIRVMCSHCPHYAEPGSSLKCWANYGSPKPWRYRPGPMSRMETFWFYAGMAAVLGYPVIFLLIGGEWFLLFLYALTVAAGGSTLKMHLCTQCMNLACPFNGTGSAARQAFLEQNPVIAKAWKDRPIR